MENKENKKWLLIMTSLVLGSSVMAIDYCEVDVKPTSFDSPAQKAILAYSKNLTATETDYIKQLDDALFSLRQQLKNHRLYSKMSKEENVKMFMNTHVYCVWDFMNLLKRLQIHFTSVQVPWRPTLDYEIRFLRRLANEIVLEEESDELDATFISHFSYYVETIRQVQNGVISDNLDRFIHDISNPSVSYDDVLAKDYLMEGTRKFLMATAKTATHDNILIPTAAFTFGREVMLPEIFTQILVESGIAKNPNLSMFVKYLDRHIELDGDYHGYLAKKMTLKLVSSQADWDLVIQTAKSALQHRIALWDDIYTRLV